MTSDNPFRKKCAIPYYGGKFRMARHIVPIIEAIPHKVYCEPFVGGGSVAFNLSKGDRRIVINDANAVLMVMYRGFALYPQSIRRRLEAIAFSRKSYQDAKFFISTCNTADFSKHNVVEISVNCYVSLCMSFSNVMGDDGGWRISKTNGNDPNTWKNRKKYLQYISNFLDEVYMDCADYQSVIKRWDSVDTLFYIDPPYPETDLGHYGSTGKSFSVERFTTESLDRLYRLLEGINGQYIISGYQTDVTPPEGSHSVEIQMVKKMGTKGERKAVEMIWSSLPLSVVSA